jgi:hypothetical protein
MRKKKGLDTGESSENRPRDSREHSRVFMALRAIRGRRSTKRVRPREEGKEHTTRLISTGSPFDALRCDICSLF